MYTDSQVIRQVIMEFISRFRGNNYLFCFCFCLLRIILYEVMKKWLTTTKPNNWGESLRTLKDVSKEGITSVDSEINISATFDVLEDHRVGVHQILYIGTDRTETKEECVKFFVEKYDMVTDPSGEALSVKQEMTVQVEFQ